MPSKAKRQPHGEVQKSSTNENVANTSTLSDGTVSIQNRRQKVFNWGALGFCGGLDILKIDKISTNL